MHPYQLSIVALKMEYCCCRLHMGQCQQQPRRVRGRQELLPRMLSGKCKMAKQGMTIIHTFFLL